MAGVPQEVVTKSLAVPIVYQHAVPVPRNDDDNGNNDSVHAKRMNKKQLWQKLKRIDKKLKCAEKTATATRKSPCQTDEQEAASAKIESH